MNPCRILWFPALFLSVALADAQVTVRPLVETDPVPTGGDAADDAVIWVHPSDPALSTVIATDKDSGLVVYDMAGNELQFLPEGQLNNVDLRHGFRVGLARVTVVTACERSQNLIAIYAVDPRTRLLHRVAARRIQSGIGVYGSCMYRSPRTGNFYLFVNSEVGEVEQWRLFLDGRARIDAVRVRSFDVGGITEGCVADDEFSTLYIGEEDIGIWRYGAEPGAGTTRVMVDSTGSGHLTADVEGLALYYASGGRGYLIASSQGDSSYVVYDRRPPNAFVHHFVIGSNSGLGIDGTTRSDGIDVMNRSLGGAFSSGAFIAQDEDNPGANQNFKLVSWSDIAASANPPLIIDPAYVP